MRLKYLLFFIPIFLASVVFAQPIPLKWEFYTGADGSKIPIYCIQLIYSVTVPSPNPGSSLVNLTIPDSIVNRLYTLCMKYDQYNFVNYGYCRLFYPNYKIVRKIYDPNTGTYSYPETWGSSMRISIASYSSNNVPNAYTVWVDTSNMNDNEVFYIVLYFYNPIIIPAREIYYGFSSSVSCPAEPFCKYYGTSASYDLANNKDDIMVVITTCQYSTLSLTYRRSIYLNLSSISDQSWYVYPSYYVPWCSGGVGIVFDLYNPSDGSVKLIGVKTGDIDTGKYPDNVVWYSVDNKKPVDIISIIRNSAIDLSKYSVLRYIYIGGFTNACTYGCTSTSIPYQIIKLPQ